MSIRFFVSILFGLFLATGCKKATISNPASSDYINELREDFYHETIMTDYEKTKLTEDFAEQLRAMSKADLADCYLFLAWTRSQKPAESLGQLQTISVFTDGYKRATAETFMPSLSEDEKKRYKLRKELPIEDAITCDTGLKQIDGRYLVMDKLDCFGDDKIKQSKEEVDVEYYVLRDFCYDAAWHYIGNGDLDSFDVKFDPSGALADLERANP